MTAAGGKLTWLFDLVEVLVEKDDQVAMELQKILDKKKSPLKPPALLKQASEQVTVDQRNSCCCSDEQSSESAETTADPRCSNCNNLLECTHCDESVISNNLFAKGLSVAPPAKNCYAQDIGIDPEDWDDDFLPREASVPPKQKNTLLNKVIKPNKTAQQKQKREPDGTQPYSAKKIIHIHGFTEATTTVNDMRSLFGKYGKIVECEIRQSKYNQKAFCTVIFEEAEDADSAVCDPPSYRGRMLTVRYLKIYPQTNGKVPSIKQGAK